MIKWKFSFCSVCKRETIHFIRDKGIECNICGKFTVLIEEEEDGYRLF